MMDDLLLRALIILAGVFALLALAQTQLPSFIEKRVMEAAVYIERTQDAPTSVSGTRGKQ